MEADEIIVLFCIFSILLLEKITKEIKKVVSNIEEIRKKPNDAMFNHQKKYKQARKYYLA